MLLWVRLRLGPDDQWLLEAAWTPGWKPSALEPRALRHGMASLELPAADPTDESPWRYCS